MEPYRTPEKPDAAQTCNRCGRYGIERKAMQKWLTSIRNELEGAKRNQYFWRIVAVLAEGLFIVGAIWCHRALVRESFQSPALFYVMYVFAAIIFALAVLCAETVADVAKISTFHKELAGLDDLQLAGKYISRWRVNHRNAQKMLLLEAKEGGDESVQRLTIFMNERFSDDELERPDLSGPTKEAYVDDD